VVVARIPVPTASPDQVVEAVVAAVTPRTRLALLSHVTSPTGLVFPIADLVRELDARGVDALVDAAHAPGMVPLDLRAIDAAYVTANAHKWLCAPKGAAFLHIREDRRHVDGRLAIRPLVTSHGANTRPPGVSPFRAEFDWVGTADPSAALSIPAALDFMAGLAPGGWPELMAANRDLAIAGRDVLCEALEIEPPAPDSLLGSLAAVPLPDDVAPGVADLNAFLYEKHRIEVPVYWWPVDAVFAPGIPPPTSRRTRILRISAQRYNDIAQYERLAAVLRDLRRQASGARSATAE
jgi:isopenicillin-N epimerase